MDILNILTEGTAAAVRNLYGEEVAADKITLTPTRREFEGDYTVVTFPFTKIAKKKPDAIAEELGQYLLQNVEEVAAFNVIKGFLNLSISAEFWKNFLAETADDKQYGQLPANGQKVLVEYCSPNTNKPLHLGHIRNILLGWSVSKIYEAVGYEVVKVQIVNDRGIAICKSMLAWQKYGEGETPASTGIKPDHFVGKWYVAFEQKFKQEYADWQQSEAGQKLLAEKKNEKQPEEAFWKKYKNTYFNEHSTLGNEARDMLLKWEAKDEAVRNLWMLMNSWVYEGFEKTFEALGVSFDKLYYESDTYILGKDIIEQGQKDGIFFQKDDGSVWIDLTDKKLDEKLVLRSDGTSVYMTQDLGTAQVRNADFAPDKMIYVVGNEQDYHFKVLFEILKELKEPYADGLHHLSYGMVNLPDGKMKSREGTVVDADDLIAEVVQEAHTQGMERGEFQELTPEAQNDIAEFVGKAALKFFILRVKAEKSMVFDPKESVDMQGQTGPYVQNAYVRIQSVLRKNAGDLTAQAADYTEMSAVETSLIQQIYGYPATLQTAADNYDPAFIADYCYNLAKSYHRFYTDHSILKAESEAAKAFRLQLSKATANVLEKGMLLLGIGMPERM